jgi:tetrahydromethanopterin S-methyltransferase subunit C
MADVSPRKVLALGVIGGLLGIYATLLNPVLGPFLAALGAVCATIWGADAIARVASYGLGTGVPSIGYMSLAIALVGSIGGLAGALIPGMPVLLGPLMGFIIAMILGAIVAFLGRTVLKMKIAILVPCTTELAGASALTVFGFSAAIAGTIAMPGILKTVVIPGTLALFFIINTMIIQHPFNACLGPNENRVRTLKLAATTGFMAMALVGLLGIKTSGGWWLIGIVGAIAWFISMRSFINASINEAASAKWSGWWPEEEEG